MAVAIPAALAAFGGASTALSVAGVVAGGISSFAASSYKRKVAEANAKVAGKNAEREIQKAGIQAQDQDFAAAQELGALVARQGASGLNMGVGSMALSLNSQKALAARDRGYTIYEGASKADAYKQQRNDYLAEASAAKSEQIFGVVKTALGVGDSLVSGATTVNKKRAISLGA